MKAIVLEHFGDASNFQEKEWPTPSPKAGEIKIKIHAAGFNPVDVKIRKGMYGGNTPLILGADCAGIVDAVGEGVKDFRVGDEVIALTFGQSSNGSYAEYTCVPVAMAVQKPKNISFEIAASLPVVALTAYRALIHTVQKGKSVLITGATGGVGFIAVQLAHLLGAHPIFTTGSDPEGQDPQFFLNYKGLSVEEMKKRLLAMNGNKLIDATFDFVGKEMRALCMEVVNFEGHLTTILNEPFQFDKAWQKSLSLHCVFVGAEAFGGGPLDVYRKAFQDMMAWIEQGKIQIAEPFVVGNLSLSSILKAHEMLEQGHKHTKLVVTLVQ